MPHYVREGGLAFDLLSSRDGERVVIGHADGVITIDLAESLDARREAQRVRLGEPYRTMLGHFRQEVGHYYQQVLVIEDPLLGECRAPFGDERASYSDALERHYVSGAPEDWAETFISEYATMHPWEDVADTFAHYLHITGTLATASAAGVVLDSDRVEGAVQHDVVPAVDYSELGLHRALGDWHWLSMMFTASTARWASGTSTPSPSPSRSSTSSVSCIDSRRLPVCGPPGSPTPVSRDWPVEGAGRIARPNRKRAHRRAAGAS